MDTVSIKGLDKAAVLAALYAGSAPLGLGVLHARPGGLTLEEANNYIAEARREYPGGRISIYFDYLRGRPLKIDLSTDELETGLYNRDAGAGEAERIINELRKAQEVSAAE